MALPLLKKCLIPLILLISASTPALALPGPKDSGSERNILSINNDISSESFSHPSNLRKSHQLTALPLSAATLSQITRTITSTDRLTRTVSATKVVFFTSDDDWPAATPALPKNKHQRVYNHGELRKRSTADGMYFVSLVLFRAESILNGLRTDLIPH